MAFEDKRMNSEELLKYITDIINGLDMKERYEGQKIKCMLEIIKLSLEKNESN